MLNAVKVVALKHVRKPAPKKPDNLKKNPTVLTELLIGMPKHVASTSSGIQDGFLFLKYPHTWLLIEP